MCPCSSASAALIRPAMPAAAVEVADVGLDRAERAEARGVGVRARNAWVSAATSIGSPSGVPVPCAST